MQLKDEYPLLDNEIDTMLQMINKNKN